MISSGVIMNGAYDGEKEIYGDNTGLLIKPTFFNKKRKIYKLNDIQRQTLSHNLFNIYECVTISSIKKIVRKMNMKTFFFKLVSDKGEGDLIFDGGFT